MNSDVILNIEKPAGMTSFKCTNIVRKIMGAKKAGHAGTLDPQAEGVLPVCINKATRCVEFFMDFGKSYRGRIKFGSSTDTMDAWGTVLETADASYVTRELLEKTLESFKGDIYQIPPQYSAIKKDGVPLYKLARKGIFTEVEPRKITIYDISLVEFLGDEAVIDVKCSKGTYIRTLFNDIGEELGCHAHMSGLYRTSYGPFTSDKSVTPEELEKAVKDGTWEQYCLPMDAVTCQFGCVTLEGEEINCFRDGRELILPVERFTSGLGESENYRLYVREKLAAVVKTEKTEQGLKILPWKFFGIEEGGN